MLVRTSFGRHRPARPNRMRIAALGVLLTLGIAGAIAPTALAATHRPSSGHRIVQIAKRYVHHARYREGGASPKHGFDCSGYTKYVYGRAHVAKLPHSADGQRRMHGMHRVSKKSRRPGDLIFYMSGGRAYHVAIYAGHGKQYAAATPRDGIRHQNIWSRHVRYARYRH